MQSAMFKQHKNANEKKNNIFRLNVFFFHIKMHRSATDDIAIEIVRNEYFTAVRQRKHVCVFSRIFHEFACAGKSTKPVSV